ncbi:flavodoxin family protein [Patescibacteria group bacterium]|nr:flavodoxin family protein [Patescibacteria group bacterium]MCL5410147.1 flavodoxin family protein [Patescibacteria group bacterium]
MKTLVIYNSLFGNTQKVAEKIAQVLKGQAVEVADFEPDFLKGIGVLVVGCPIHGWRPAEPMSELLDSWQSNCLQNIKIAAFDTRVKIFFAGSAADKIEEKLVSLGGKAVVKPIGFVVEGKEGPLREGELEKVATWAKQIKNS